MRILRMIKRRSYNKNTHTHRSFYKTRSHFSSKIKKKKTTGLYRRRTVIFGVFRIKYV